jgi:murein DD-endopeptidase MepM/ murein hydrolase activator NlpD
MDIRHWWDANIFSTGYKTTLFASAFILNACTTTQPPTSSPSPAPPTETAAQLDLKECPMRITNSPLAQANQRSAIACIERVELYVAPAPGACLSSGYGKRGARPHKGVDYQSKPAGPVVAAGSGRILKIDYRQKDYGHWVIIDHGRGVYTSYAHLANVEERLSVGTPVKQGQKLGVMGNSGAAAKAVHLHYELRKGDYHNPKGWWGLNPLNPFALSERCS